MDFDVLRELQQRRASSTRRQRWQRHRGRAKLEIGSPQWTVSAAGSSVRRLEPDPSAYKAN
jgi:hypothetical protein